MLLASYSVWARQWVGVQAQLGERGGGAGGGGEGGAEARVG